MKNKDGYLSAREKVTLNASIEASSFGNSILSLCPIHSRAFGGNEWEAYATLFLTDH
jgi:hypothetical protein